MTAFFYTDTIIWTVAAAESIQEIRKDGIDIWKLNVTHDINTLHDLSSLLSQDERERGDKYFHNRDKNRFITSRGYLRLLLGRYLIKPGKEIKFVKGVNNKPYVLNMEDMPIYYNISHSGDIILISIGDTDMGIDIEKKNTDFNFDEIIASAFNNQEIDYIISMKDNRSAFYQLWTRKEALLKALGKGLTDNLPVVPSLDGLHAIDTGILETNVSWNVKSFNVEDGYVASIAYNNQVDQIRYQQLLGIKSNTTA